MASVIDGDPEHKRMFGITLPLALTKAVIAWPWFALIGAGTTVVVGWFANHFFGKPGM